MAEKNNWGPAIHAKILFAYAKERESNVGISITSEQVSNVISFKFTKYELI